MLTSASKHYYREDKRLVSLVLSIYQPHYHLLTSSNLVDRLHSKVLSERAQNPFDSHGDSNSLQNQESSDSESYR